MTHHKYIPSPLSKIRERYVPPLPAILKQLDALRFVPQEISDPTKDAKELKTLFPKTFGQPLLSATTGEKSQSKPLRVAVVFSGGQASGGHNVISGLFDALQSIHPASHLLGFLDGPSGIIHAKTKEITLEELKSYRNQGGFDLIGSGRTKIETEAQFQAALNAAQTLKLDGLVVVGGDDSNTNAAHLAEYFLAKGSSTRVIGVPKTIDGDLKNPYVATSFGFDTACKIYSEMIGNIARDALSAKKYYHFIKLMGRSASHIALECALTVQPNLTLIGEEVASHKHTLQQITLQVADLISSRAEMGKYFGVIIIPEGLIEFIPEMSILITELNVILSKHEDLKISEILQSLTAASQECFKNLPESIQKQMLLNRDPHGNVQVSFIETEKLLIETVTQELKRRSKATFNRDPAVGDGKVMQSFESESLPIGGAHSQMVKGPPIGRDSGSKDCVNLPSPTAGSRFNPVAHFFGYEGRAGFPSNFDCNYCYALGQTAALLIKEGMTGYMSCVRNLNSPVANWQVGGVPITALMHLEMRKGKLKPVIQKALVDLNGNVFSQFKKLRKQWELEDHYISPGPIQFSSDPSVTDVLSLSIFLESCN